MNSKSRRLIQEFIVSFLIFSIMAKQKSFLKVAGTLDGLTFYKSVDGHLVRTKGGVSKGRIMNDPAYIRTR